MLSRANPKNGMGQFVIRHSLHAIRGNAWERSEARISLGLRVTRDAIYRPVDLLILCRWHSPSQLIAVPARLWRVTVIRSAPNTGELTFTGVPLVVVKV